PRLVAADVVARAPRGARHARRAPAGDDGDAPPGRDRAVQRRGRRVSVLLAGELALDGELAPGWVELDGARIARAAHGPPPRAPGCIPSSGSVRPPTAFLRGSSTPRCGSSPSRPSCQVRSSSSLG